MAARTGSAEWKGTLKEGEGSLSVGDGIFSGPFTFGTRFGDDEGANPEQLIAAAHAACFTMALSNALHLHDHAPISVRTTASAYIRQIDEKPTIAKIELNCEAEVPGIDESHFLEHAEAARKDCIVTRALAGVPEIELAAKLVG